MACIYVLYSSSSNKFYVGSTRDADSEVRLKAHNFGKTRSTKSGRPWTLVYQESFEAYRDARKQEIFYKTGRGREILKNRLTKNHGEVA